jgi:hypothetical protein
MLWFRNILLNRKSLPPQGAAFQTTQKSPGNTPGKLSSVTRAGTKAVGELAGAISAPALNANLNSRRSCSIVQAYFTEKQVSTHFDGHPTRIS